MPISTRELSTLPAIEPLRRLLQSMALLDAILQPEWQYRYYSFNSQWAGEEQMGSMRDGEGDEFFALFNSRGCFLKGFAHEAAMTPYKSRPPKIWPGVLDYVPSDFSSCLAEPAFSMESTTFVIWRRYSDPEWQRGTIEFPAKSDPDGSEAMLSMLDGNAKTYQQWAQEYHERDVDLTVVQNIYDHSALTDDLVKALNSELTVLDLKADIAEIGYPSK